MSKRKKARRLSDGRMPWEPKAATLERRDLLQWIDPLVREAKRRPHNFFPDLGTELLLRGVDYQFTLVIHPNNDYYLGQDRILGWLFTRPITLLSFEIIDSPVDLLFLDSSKMMVSIAFGKVQKEEVIKQIEILQSTGLMVQASRSDGYRTKRSGGEYVVPLRVL